MQIKSGDSALVKENGKQIWINIVYTDGKKIIGMYESHTIEIMKDNIIDVFNEEICEQKICDLSVDEQKLKYKRDIMSRRSFCNNALDHDLRTSF